MLVFKKTIQKKAPRPGFEPGSKAPEASRMSTTLPRHYATMSMSGSRFHTNNVTSRNKTRDRWKIMRSIKLWKPGIKVRVFSHLAIRIIKINKLGLTLRNAYERAFAPGPKKSLKKEFFWRSALGGKSCRTGSLRNAGPDDVVISDDVCIIYAPVRWL